MKRNYTSRIFSCKKTLRFFLRGCHISILVHIHLYHLIIYGQKHNLYMNYDTKDENKELRAILRNSLGGFNRDCGSLVLHMLI